MPDLMNDVPQKEKLVKPLRSQTGVRVDGGPSTLIPILLLLLAFIAIATVFSGCPKHPQLEGRVTDKTHTPDVWAVQFNAALKMLQPVFYPGAYRVEITRLNSSKADCEVSREEFASIQIGQHYVCK